MCGIAGVWRHDGSPVDAGVLDPMLAAIIHRGPDDSGVWQDGRVGFGHRRLSILDLSDHAHQPMVRAAGDGVLIYNGEVYNYAALGRELERLGAIFRGTGDSEVVLEALHRWGPEEAIPRFDGMFAFAYLDRRNETLWLARDRVGIKTLSVTDTGAELVFASEVKALLAHPRVRKRADTAAIFADIVNCERAGHRTLFEGIDGLGPGTWWRVRRDGLVKHRYFHVLDAVDVERVVAARKADPRGFVAPLRAALRASVKSHLVSDVPLAAMCSGGVDSSLIAAYASGDVPSLRGYVADLPFSSNEGPQAERVGRHLGVPIRRIHVDRERFLRLWPRAVWHSDAPPYLTSDVAMLAVTYACRADGFKVLLTGEGSDELFGGYSYYARTLRRWRWLERPWSLFVPPSLRRRMKQRLDGTPFSTDLGASAGSALRRKLVVAHCGDDQFLPQQLMEKLAPVEPASDRAVLAHCLSHLYDHLSRILHRHDRIGMAASLEMRVPFLQNDLFDFAFHLPRPAKVRRDVGKWVVKQVAEEVLPRDIVYAPKKGFPMPTDFTRGTAALLAGGLLAEHLGWTRPTTVRVIGLLDGDPWLRAEVVGLELWLRIFFDGQAPDALGETLVRAAA